MESHLALCRFANDTEAITEALVRPRVMARFVTETEAITEAVEQHRSITQLAGDTLAITEALLHPMALTRTATDTLAITETATPLAWHIPTNPILVVEMDIKTLVTSLSAKDLQVDMNVKHVRKP